MSRSFVSSPTLSPSQRRHLLDDDEDDKAIQRTDGIKSRTHLRLQKQKQAGRQTGAILPRGGGSKVGGAACLLNYKARGIAVGGRGLLNEIIVNDE